MKKKTEKGATPYCAVLLALVSILVLGCPGLGVDEENSANKSSVLPAETQWEEKIYWTGSIDDNFEDNSVLVVMDKNIGGVNKRHDKSFFGGIEIESIEDLTEITGDIDSKKYLNKEKFHQILKLTLPVKSKENVVNVIRHLEKIDGILAAESNYYFSW